MAIRVGSVLCQPKVFLEILNMQKEFWKLDGLKDGDKDELKNITRLSYMACRILTNSMYASVAVMHFIGVITHELPLHCFIPNKYGLNYYTLLIIQGFHNSAAVLLIIGFDVIFITLCTNVIVQFKMIKWRLQNIQFDESCEDYNENRCRNQLEQCIKYKIKMNR